MNIGLPSVGDITDLLTALDAHPLGATFLLLLILAGILGVWVYRQAPPPTKARALRTKARKIF